MSIFLRKPSGHIEAVIDEDGGLNTFYEVAYILNKEYKVKFINKNDEFDTIVWDFRFRRHSLSLHYNIYSGVSIISLPSKYSVEKDNKVVKELSIFLQTRLENRKLQNKNDVAVA